MSNRTAALCRLLAPPPDPRDDGDLLTAFVRSNDEAAFAELIRRHGPLMLSACRRLLPDRADAEDAFQSAFLVLVRRAARVNRLPSLGPWLYRVAVLTARNFRRHNARRFARQTVLPDSLPAHPPSNDIELRLDLDAALLGLPEKLRTPIVLCHLQGWSRRDAAQRLGCPEGTLSSLLARGLAKLRRRLGDFDPAKLLAVSPLLVPAALSSSTARAATSALASNACHMTLSTLAEGVLRMFWIKKTTAATMALAVVFGMGVGIGVSVRQVPQAGAVEDETRAAAPAAILKSGASLINESKPVDDLKQQLAAAKKDVDVACATWQLAQAKLELAAKTGTPAAVEKAWAELQFADAKVAVAKQRYESRLVAFVLQEAELKSQPKTNTIPSEPDKQVAEAKALLEQLRAQRLQIEADLRKLQRNAQDLDAKSEAVMEQLKLLELKRAKEAKDKAVVPPLPAASGPAFVVTITEENPNFVCTLTEIGANGKMIGTLTCDNADILRVTLSRAAKDQAAPKELRISVKPTAKYSQVVSVLDACKAAGFKDAKVSTLGPPIAVPKNITTKLLEATTIDSYLEKYAPVKP